MTSASVLEFTGYELRGDAVGEGIIGAHFGGPDAINDGAPQKQSKRWKHVGYGPTQPTAVVVDRLGGLGDGGEVMGQVDAVGRPAGR